MAGPARCLGADQFKPSSVDREKTMRLPTGPSGALIFWVQTAMSEPSGPSNTRKCSLPVSVTSVSVTLGTKTTKSGLVTFNSLATNAIAGADETTPLEVNLPVTGLLAGTNVLAVEIHQRSADSSDISFDFELAGAQTYVAPFIVTQPVGGTVAEGASLKMTRHVLEPGSSVTGAGAGSWVGRSRAASPALPLTTRAWRDCAQTGRSTLELPA